MRIGIDARLWNETGVGRYIRNLVTELQVIDTKNEYTLFLPTSLSTSVFLKDLQSANPTWQFRFTDIRWHSIREQLLFPRLLRKEQLDLVHFPYFSMPIFYNRAYVITIHDLIINSFPTGKASTLPLPVYYAKHASYSLLIRQAARRAKRVITVSEATKKEIHRQLQVPMNTISVTYEGVDGAFTQLNTKSSTYNNYFLFVGNAYPHKNPEILIPVFQKLIKTHPDVMLLFVGEMNYFYKRLQAEVYDNSLQKTIRFLGRVDDETLSSLYQNAHALITPSLMEGFGLPGLEAMQHGCLVLAADIAVYHEIYGESAVYFDPRSVASIHATIRAVLDDNSKFRHNKQKGFACVKKYSWQTMTKQTVNIYENCTRIR